jgi:uncharacterized protein YukE
MAETFAGITVPEGEPGAVRDAAQTFRGLAGSLHGVGGDIRAVPGMVSDWQGLAASAFHGTAPTNGSCIDAAAEAMTTCAEAARTYAEELEDAQKEAEAAIEEARDAQRRIDQAQSDLENALSAQITASDQIMSASTRMSSGLPDPGASADLDAATTAMSTAQNAESDARRRLERAQEDLRLAQKRGEKAEQAAKDAARAAAGAFEGVAGGSPAAAVFGGSPTAIEADVLARVRAGDYSVLDTVPMNYLPEDTQRAIGAEMAKDSDAAATGDGDHSIDEMGDIVGRYGHDEEVATGFYNQLGGEGARDFVSNMAFFNHQGEGWDNPELVQMMAPFATLLGTATTSGGLKSGFTGGFLRHDLKPRDRLGGHNELKAFVMAGEADNYSSDFLADVGKEVLIMPLDPANEDIPGHVEISEHQDLMSFIAGNPEAAGTLLAGRHGPENHFTNASALLNYGPRFTDDGEALGALIESGTHDLRYDNQALANDAAHAVIQSAPPYVEHLGDKAKPALVTILDDHIVDFEHVATDRAEEGPVLQPDGTIDGLTYEEGHEYLKALIADDDTRTDAGNVVADRVAWDVDMAGATGDLSHSQKAGALSEMSVLATADADLDQAKQDAFMTSLGEKAAGKVVDLAPGGRVIKEVANVALGEIFSSDHVENALKDSCAAQTEALTAMRRLSLAAQVEHGRLPEQVLDHVGADGLMDLDTGQTGVDDVLRDANGDPLQWDLDGSGKIEADEREITETELYAAATPHTQVAADAMNSLAQSRNLGDDAPDVSSLPLPDGLRHEDENFAESIWPFDERSIESTSGGSVDYSELRWDAEERIYHLPIEQSGVKSELHYQYEGEDKWKLVERDSKGQWVDAK